MEILQYVGIVLLSSWVISLFRKNSEFGMGVLIAAALVMLWMIADLMAELLDVFKRLADASGLSAASFSSIIKVVGTGYIADLAARLCRDQGLDALAFQVETAGRLLILIASMPILEKLIVYITELMEL